MTTAMVHVLVVEDDDVDVMGLERAFRARNLANPIHRARNGAEALAMLRGQPGHPTVPSPQVVILDLNMPRMNGLEFLQQLRGDATHARDVVFVFTTSNDNRDRTAAYDLGIAGYVVKDSAGGKFDAMAALLEHYWRVVELP